MSELDCICESEFPEYCGEECACFHHHESPGATHQEGTHEHPHASAEGKEALRPKRLSHEEYWAAMNQACSALYPSASAPVELPKINHDQLCALSRLWNSTAYRRGVAPADEVAVNEWLKHQIAALQKIETLKAKFEASDEVLQEVNKQLSAAQQRITELKKALKEIVALEFGRTEEGKDDFYTGAPRFVKAWLIAHNALGLHPSTHKELLHPQQGGQS